MTHPIMRLAPCLSIAVIAVPAASASPWRLHTVGARGTDRISSVAAMPDGGVVIAGQFEGELDLGSDRLVSAGESDAFIARLDAGGGVDWAASVGGDGYDVATAVVVDRAGNPILVGDLAGSLAGGDRPLHVRGLSDAFVVSFRPDGTVRWRVAFGGPDWDATSAAALTSHGDIAVTGSTGTIDGGDASTRTADTDVLVALVAADGRLRWMRSFGGPEWDGGLAVAADRKGGVAIAGAFTGRLSLDSRSLESAGPSDGFLLRLTARGAVAAADRFGGDGNDAVTAVTIAPDGTAALAGRFSGGIRLGEERLVSAGGTDVFIARAGRDGQLVGAIRAGGAGDDEARALCEMPGGALLVAATYGPGEAALHLVPESGALYDVARLAGSFVSVRGLAVTSDGSAAVAGAFADRLLIDSRPVAGAAGLDGFLMTMWLDVWGD